MSLPGAFKAKKKNGEIYFRSSITYRNKHISLGSYSTEEAASSAYLEAKEIIEAASLGISDYSDSMILDFEKYVSLINFRDSGVYIKNPIYLEKKYFLYYMNPKFYFKFDIDDLFYYAEHKISMRGGHLFLADYGMQVNLLSRYGIKPYSVMGRDYYFINGDKYDFRYANIEVVNKYNGVYKKKKGMTTVYKAKILVNGLYTIGTYDTETEAAIAYNKAADMIKKKIPGKNYRLNYIEDISPREYAKLYLTLPLNDRLYKDFS